MRVNGKQVASKDDVEKAIIKLLEHPMTRAQLATALKRNPSTLWRDYLNPMVAKGVIEKQGDYYKRKGAVERVVEKEHFDDIIKKSGFAQLPLLADYVSHMRSLRAGIPFIAKAYKMCTGKIVPTFKCRPEHWTRETTTQFLQAYREHRKTDRIDGNLRQMIRYWHDYVLHDPITDAEKSLWGVDGKKDNAGAHAYVKLTDSQIHALADYYLNKGDLETAAWVCFEIETFARPKMAFKAPMGAFKPVERTIKLAHVDGFDEPIYDASFIQMLQVLNMVLPAGRVRVETVHDEIFEGQIYEAKTDHTWPKFIVDPKAVKVVREWLQTRKDKATIFGSGETFEQFMDRLSPILKQGYDEVNATDRYFTQRPLYALRHIGAHLWLRRTAYNYAAVAEMGWEDITTLKKYYGGFDRAQLDKQLMRRW